MGARALAPALSNRMRVNANAARPRPSLCIDDWSLKAI
jgi:hypothetical protein